MICSLTWCSTWTTPVCVGVVATALSRVHGISANVNCPSCPAQWERGMRQGEPASLWSPSSVPKPVWPSLKRMPLHTGDRTVSFSSLLYPNVYCIWSPLSVHVPPPPPPNQSQSPFKRSHVIRYRRFGSNDGIDIKKRKGNGVLCESYRGANHELLQKEGDLPRTLYLSSYCFSQNRACYLKLNDKKITLLYHSEFHWPKRELLVRCIR